MNAVATYQENSVSTQSRGRIVVLLYEGAIKFMKQAILALEEQNYEAKGRYIGRAQDIINELNVVLNMEVGGEIAKNLRSLYCFMNTYLSKANTERSPEMLNDVINIMEELNEGWKAVA
ncbi:MAG TPA: flagellar export chaperone FliS [Sedimentisphaerales bacterium]|nr:flagellar export chaperone FliS [Sedimentisphaerales bacterium]